jgi:hypothetical protein
MFEVSESELKPVNNATESFAGGSWAGVVRECVEGALATKLISAEDQIVSLYHRCLSQSPTLKHTLQTLACPFFIYQAGEHGNGRRKSDRQEGQPTDLWTPKTLFLLFMGHPLRRAGMLGDSIDLFYRTLANKSLIHHKMNSVPTGPSPGPTLAER